MASWATGITKWWERGEEDLFSFRGIKRANFEQYKKRRSMVELTRKAYMTCRIHGMDSPEIKFDHNSLESNGETNCKGKISLNPLLIHNHPIEEHEGLVLGVALHEAEHNLISKEIVTEMGRADQFLSRALNYCEDARVEWSARERSPGFAKYLDQRSAITMTKGFDVLRKEWEDIDPFTKATTISLLTLKYDRAVLDFMRDWEREGIHPFKIASALRPLCKDVTGVKKAAEELAKMFKYFARRDGADFDLKKFVEEFGEGDADDEAGEGGASEGEAGEKGETGEKGEAGEGTPSEGEGEGEGEGGGSDGGEAGEEGGDGAGTEWSREEEQQARRSCASTGRGEAESSSEPTAYMSQRRASGDICEQHERLGEHAARVVKEMIQAAEEDLADKVEELGDEENNNYGSVVSRKVSRSTPKIGGKFYMEKKYIDTVTKRCRSKVKLLQRKVSIVRHADKSSFLKERQEGEIDFDKLASARISRRVFKLANVCKTEGLSLCLLLDESGSMHFDYGHKGSFVDLDTRASKVLDMAYTIVAALQKAPNMEIFVYSHGSAPGSDYDCMYKELYSPENPDIKGIFNYTGSVQNYDHIAIKRIGEEFLQRATCERKMFLVLSDGAPEGEDYGGEGAKRLTGAEVKRLEKKGVNMSMVQIGFADPDLMFTHYLDLRGHESSGDLTSPLAKFLMKQMKKSKVQ